MPRSSFMRFGSVCALCCALGGGAQDEPQHKSIQDTVMLIQSKASTAAESQQFPMFMRPPRSALGNPIKDAMQSSLQNAFQNAMNNYAAQNPKSAVANLVNFARSTNTDTAASPEAEDPMPAARPKAITQGFNVIVDNANSTGLKLAEAMDQHSISADTFYANVAIIDRFGMRVPQDKVPNPEQYPIIYRYTEAAKEDLPMDTGLQGSAAEAKSQADQVLDNFMNIIGGGTSKPMTGNRREHDLAFVAVPSNFERDIEKAALANSALQASAEQADPAAAATVLAQGKHVTAGPGGALWGRNDESLHKKSEITGCALYATPPKYWPEDLAAKYFALDEKRQRTITGVLRDPYDKIANEFRMRAEGGAQEGPEYQKLYDTCDLNSWVKKELKNTQKDAVHGDCHFLPQAEFFEGPYGIKLPIDARYMPLSFNEVMERHGYEGVWLNPTPAPGKCDVSAWSLDTEAKAMIKHTYARDFELLCKHFGYCDANEITCMSHLSGMCGGAPTPAPLPEEPKAEEETKVETKENKTGDA